MWSYCNNCPVISYDPNGEWNWKKFLVTAAICVAVAAVVVAATIATAGGLTAVATSVIATTVIKATATVAIAATATTATAIPIIAGMEKVAVLDLSLSAQTRVGVSVKVGASLVLDFKNNRSEIYYHRGEAFSASSSMNSIGIIYSVGIVEGYENEGDYSGPFVNMGAYCKGFGIDHCYDPRKDHDDTVRAYSATFGSGTGGYVGLDKYKLRYGWDW